MKLTIFLIAVVVANAAIDHGYAYFGWPLLAVATWEAAGSALWLKAQAR